MRVYKKCGSIRRVYLCRCALLCIFESVLTYVSKILRSVHETGYIDVCVRMCVRVFVCVCACLRVCVCVYMCVGTCTNPPSMHGECISQAIRPWTEE